jgi:hypothetical protein
VTALGDLRRRTLGRATRGYLVWIGRAVGWWTIVYLAFWAVVFAIAGAETLVRLDEPLSAAVPLVAAWGVAVAFAAHVLAGRAPPVVLDRRDLYRLALAPTEPYAVLRWRLTVRRALAVAFGAVVGAVWSLLAPPLFHVQAPWAAPALALVALAYVDVAWLRYAGFRRDDADGRSASLASSWPPRFAAQSLVLTQLQAMRTLRLLAGVAGMVSGREADAAERERLLATLHDRPGATRPRRSLRPPALDRRPWRAIAWRAASALVRRRALAQLQVVAWSVAAVAAGWAAAPALIVDGLPAAGAPGVVQPAGVVDPLGAAVVAALGVLGGAWLLARAGAALLGPDLPRGTVPVDAAERTRGRLAVPVVVLTVAAVPAYALASALRGWVGLGAAGQDPLLTAMALAALLLTVLITLEKYATWTGVAAGAWEATLVAALVATLPSLLLGLFGVPGAALPLQLVLLTLLWWLPV